MVLCAGNIAGQGLRDGEKYNFIPFFLKRLTVKYLCFTHFFGCIEPVFFPEACPDKNRLNHHSVADKQIWFSPSIIGKIKAGLCHNLFSVDLINKI